MADIHLTAEGTPATPTSGAATIFVTKPLPSGVSGMMSGSAYALGATPPVVGGIDGINGVTSIVPSNNAVSARVIILPQLNHLATVDDAGNTRVLRPLANQITTAISSPISDTYIDGVRFNAPPHNVKVGSVLRWRFAAITKIGGAVAFNIRVWTGMTGSTGDSTMGTLTAAGSTSASDTAYVEVTVVIQAVGQSGGGVATMLVLHNNTTTGFNTQSCQVATTAISGSINRQPQIFGISFQGGSSFNGSIPSPFGCMFEAFNV